MPINPNIAMSGRPIQLDNPLAQYAQFSQIQNAQKQNELAALQVEAAKRGAEEEVAVKNFFAQNPDLASPETRNKLTGFGKTGLAYSKLLSEQETANLTRDQLKQTIYKQKRDFGTQALRDLSLNPSDENIIAFGQDAVIQKLMTPEESAAKTKQLLGMPVPERQAYMAAQGAQSKELMALFESKPVQRSDGQRTWLEESNPRLPTFGQVVRAPIQMQATPGEVLRANTPASVAEFERARTDPAFMDFLQKRAAATRAPVQPVAPTVIQIVDPTNPTQMISVDARRYQGGGVGSQGVLGVGGKEPGAAIRVNKAEEGKTQLADDLENLRFSFQTLDNLRAIPSTERGALSNVTSGLASTAIGQKTGQFFATQAQVERDVINSARSRLVNSIKNATGMSAQQLNSNVELQTMLKSISDPGQSYQSAIRIIDDIEDAYVKGKGMKKRGAPAPGPAAGPAQIAPPAGFVPDQR